MLRFSSSARGAVAVPGARLLRGRFFGREPARARDDRQLPQVAREPGALPEASLRDLIEKVMEIDMDEVRAELASKKEGQDS